LGGGYKLARNKFNIDERLEGQFNINHLKRLFSYIKPYKKKMYLSMLIMLLASIAGLIGPYLVKIAIDQMIPVGNIAGLWILAGIFVISLLITGVCLKYKIRSMNEVGQNVIFDIRKHLFTHLQELSFNYYDSRPHGKILVRVVNYVNALSDLLSNGLINMVTELFSLIVILVFMITISPKLTLIALAGLPFLAGAVLIIKNAQRKAWQVLSSKTSNMNAYVHESICGMKITQSFAREKESLNIYKELCNEYRTSWLHAVGIQFMLWPAIDNISMITIVAIFLVGISWIGRGVTIGTLIAFIGYIWRFWQPIMNLGNFYNSIIMAMAYLERIFEAIDEEVVVKDVEGAGEMPEIKGRVEFENVEFSYDEGHKILKGISFTAEPGECIAVVGATGCGKSTIINLVSRFYNLDSGKVLIDGTDIQMVTLESLRKQMGIMLQDSFIFSGTIMDNIRYGRLDATDEEVIEASKAVRAHEFIVEFTDGYETEVNERGTRLSVGQRQLIAFARTLLANPKILILDEATSSIDTKTEIALQHGLEELLKGRTSFIIAHRLSTIKNATKILYIEEGKLIEQGTHQELMKQKGAYYKLYNSQYELMKAI
jgi:ATP-binding cassette, subfamily B, multidrug efflux pump